MKQLWRLVWIFGFSGAGFAIGFLGFHSSKQFKRGVPGVPDVEICARNGFIGLAVALVVLFGLDLLNQALCGDENEDTT